MATVSENENGSRSFAWIKFEHNSFELQIYLYIFIISPQNNINNSSFYPIPNTHIATAYENMISWNLCTRWIFIMIFIASQIDIYWSKHIINIFIYIDLYFTFAFFCNIAKIWAKGNFLPISCKLFTCNIFSFHC